MNNLIKLKTARDIFNEYKKGQVFEGQVFEGQVFAGRDSNCRPELRFAFYNPKLKKWIDMPLDYFEPA